jgi:hypothetical protein
MNLPDLSDENAKRIAYLLNGFITESLSSAEMDELIKWVAADQYNSAIFEQLTDARYVEQMKEDIKNNSDKQDKSK